jgi:indolepyruvate decarboxylase
MAAKQPYAGNESTTVIGYLLSRLKQIGVTDYFGVPGDFSFPVTDAICSSSDLRFIGTCNELNAAYAADGYARIKGISAISTTFGPGELGALPGIAGAFAENLPIFHIAGQPNRSTQKAKAIVHHTLGDGDFSHFHKMTAPAVCASTVMTPENCVQETKRLISAALYHSQPVYIALPTDVVDQPVDIRNGAVVPAPVSDAAALETVVNAIVDKLDRARSACILPGALVARLELKNDMTALVEASGLPFATMMMDKSTLDESHPNSIGMYEGAWSDESIRSFIEEADCILAVGSMASDFNTAAFTARVDRARIIHVMHHRTRVGYAIFENVEMKDVVRELSKKLSKRTDIVTPQHSQVMSPTGAGDDPITADALYPRWSRFIRPNDIVVSESGTNVLGLASARLPKGATFHNQTLWGAIGWATPAAFGASLAAPDRRTVLITGEGSHQMTAQEIGQFHRFGTKPVIFVLNNDGYLIERLLCKDPEMYYNDLAPWRYHLLPQALGCDGWNCARVATCGELDAAMEKAAANDQPAYIEVMTGKFVAPPLAMKMHESTQSLYNGR